MISCVSYFDNDHEPDEPWWYLTRENIWYKANVVAAIAVGVYAIGFRLDDIYDWVTTPARSFVFLIVVLAITVVTRSGSASPPSTAPGREPCGPGGRRPNGARWRMRSGRGTSGRRERAQPRMLAGRGPVVGTSTIPASPALATPIGLASGSMQNLEPSRCLSPSSR